MTRNLKYTAHPGIDRGGGAGWGADGGMKMLDMGGDESAG